MGHVRNYSIGDAMARFQRLMGKNVLYPMGYDSFGMPAENAAKKEGGHPHEVTHKNISSIRSDQQRMGYSYDWRRFLATSDVEYYKWNQEMFLMLNENGLVERRMAPVKEVIKHRYKIMPLMYHFYWSIYLFQSINRPTSIYHPTYTFF